MGHGDASFVVVLLGFFVVSTFGPILVMAIIFGAFMGLSSLFSHKPPNYSGLAKSLLLSLAIQAAFVLLALATSQLWQPMPSAYLPTIAMVLSWLVGSAIYIYCLVWRYSLTKCE